MKTFRVVTSLSIILTLMAAALSVIGVAVTGLYPGMIVLFVMAMIPIASKFYTKKIVSKSIDFQRMYLYITYGY